MGRIAAPLAAVLIVAAWLPARAGEITGKVTFSGEPPAQPAATPAKDQRKACGGDEIPDQSLQVANGAVANVLVWLERPAQETKVGTVEVAFDRCRLQPRALVVPVGTTLAIRNGDEANHSVHGRLDGASIFHVALPIPGMTIRRTLDKPGLVELRCSAGHAWEKAFLRVLPHPLGAVSAADGTFRIADVPDGPVTLIAWHEVLGEKRVELKVAGTATADVSYAAPEKK